MKLNEKNCIKQFFTMKNFAELQCSIAFLILNAET